LVTKTTIHRALYRPALFVGCERLPFTLVVTLGGILIMAYQTLWITGVVLAFYLVSLVLIRRVNEHDPQFFRCLYRYVRYYKDYYPANAFYPGKADKPLSHFE
jgi:type IV secretory pathway TrbD component